MPQLLRTSSVAAAAVATIFVLLNLPTGSTSIPTHEVDAMLSALHFRGPYNLIANAIATSDLLFDILDSPSFTLFAPPDRSLFPVALALPSTAYVSALRLLSSPHRYSSSYLHHLISSSAATSIPTLLTPWSLRLHAAGAILALDNVVVSFPGIFSSHHIAVHGISGMISLRGERHFSPPTFSVVIPGKHDRYHGRCHFFRRARFGNRTNRSLKKHRDDCNHHEAVSLFGFSPLPAPAPLMLEKASPFGFTPMPAPVTTRLDKANNISGNVRNSKILGPSTGITAKANISGNVRNSKNLGPSTGITAFHSGHQS